MVYSNIYPTRCNVTQFIYIWKLLYMFRVVLPPIIRSANNCIYSIWYLSHRYCYLPLSWKTAITVWQVPEAVYTVVCTPDDGWWYHPKHVEQFPGKNELCNIASCWIYIGKLLRCTNPWTLSSHSSSQNVLHFMPLETKKYFTYKLHLKTWVTVGCVLSYHITLWSRILLKRKKFPPPPVHICIVTKHQSLFVSRAVSPTHHTLTRSIHSFNRNGITSTVFRFMAD
jgi:hypothetical protein